MQTKISNLKIYSRRFSSLAMNTASMLHCYSLSPLSSKRCALFVASFETPMPTIDKHDIILPLTANAVGVCAVIMLMKHDAKNYVRWCGKVRGGGRQMILCSMYLLVCVCVCVCVCV